jgi:peptide methionine sulfoxide reductase msrA/msrB
MTSLSPRLRMCFTKSPPSMLVVVVSFIGLCLIAKPALAVDESAKRNTLSNNSKPGETEGPSRASAVFAGGCFWCVESDFEKAPGVIEVISGYSGGRSKSPTYQSYTTGGHREVVFIVYDPAQVTYAGLVEYLLKHIDPTDRTGAFIDKGPQYSPAIYYETNEEKVEAERVCKAIDAMKVLRGKVNVPILKRQPFWPAEAYHQEYHSNNPIKYGNYRATCGRDNFVQRVWGPAAQFLTIPGAFPKGSDGEKLIAEFKGTRSGTKEETLTEISSTKAAWINFKKPTDKELRKKLTPLQFDVTQKSSTEPAFRNPFWNNHDEGLYVDIVSGEPLFSSTDKFDSGTGWPSFVKPIERNALTTREDYQEAEPRTEVRSRIADSHLGQMVQSIAAVYAIASIQPASSLFQNASWNRLVTQNTCRYSINA